MNSLLFNVVTRDFLNQNSVKKSTGGKKAKQPLKCKARTPDDKIANLSLTKTSYLKGGRGNSFAGKKTGFKVCWWG